MCHKWLRSMDRFQNRYHEKPNRNLQSCRCGPSLES
jgi:hypothetical protein